jgi:hypothetical protein
LPGGGSVPSYEERDGVTEAAGSDFAATVDGGFIEVDVAFSEEVD